MNAAHNKPADNTNTNVKLKLLKLCEKVSHVSEICMKFNETMSTNMSELKQLSESLVHELSESDQVEEAICVSPRCLSYLNEQTNNPNSFFDNINLDSGSSLDCISEMLDRLQESFGVHSFEPAALNPEETLPTVDGDELEVVEEEEEDLIKGPNRKRVRIESDTESSESSSQEYYTVSLRSLCSKARKFIW